MTPPHASPPAAAPRGTVPALLGGWGNFRPERCYELRAETIGRACGAIRDDASVPWIARGLGRAYGDSAVNGDRGVLTLTGLDRFQSFDPTTGTLRCEAGVSLAEIIRCLLPHGWFPAVTPGTKFVTVGGAIAADVHGKNHHRVGSFGNFVDSFRLLTAGGELLSCSRTDNSPLFFATLGGMGLTGCIVDAQLRLQRVETCYAAVEFVRTRDLDETLDCFLQTDATCQYSVAWIDSLAAGKSLGRSVVMLGNDAPLERLPPRLRARPLELPRKRAKSVPCMLPGWVLNPLSVKAFNALYYATHPSGSRLVDFNSFFYPLDGVRSWNRIYGRRGFVQFQALLPPATSRAGLTALLTEIAASRRASFLAVLKACGAAGEGLLSYLHPGHTLALDFPNTGPDLAPFVLRLEEILLRHGGRLYLAKDSLMRAETFRASYPRLDEFLAIKREADPHGRFGSTQSRRLELT